MGRWSLGLVIPWIVALQNSVPAPAQEHTQEPEILFSVTQNGNPIAGNVAVSGLVDVEVQVRGGFGKAVQVYVNLLLYHGVHHIASDSWSHRFTIDTRGYFDGQQLLSVHVHQHESSDVRIDSTSFDFAKRIISTSNNLPAPVGDGQLPELDLPPGDFFVAASGERFMLHADATMRHESIPHFDDPVARGGQILSHANGAILGRETFGGSPNEGPIATGIAVSEVAIRPFQNTSGTTPFKAVFFIADAVGRANLEERRLTLPPMTEFDAHLFSDPLPNARIVNVIDGDDVIVGSVPFKLRVILENLSPAEYPDGLTLRTWVGNDALALTSLRDVIRANGGHQSFEIEVPIRRDLLKLNQHSRGIVRATATAIWVDFARPEAIHDWSWLSTLVTRGHVHVNSIRPE